MRLATDWASCSVSTTPSEPGGVGTSAFLARARLTALSSSAFRARAFGPMSPGLGHELTHLERHWASKLVGASAHNGGGFCDHGRPPGESRVPPVLEAG